MPLIPLAPSAPCCPTCADLMEIQRPWALPPDWVVTALCHTCHTTYRFRAPLVPTVD